MNPEQPIIPSTIEESIKRLNDTTNIKRLNKEADDFLEYLKSLKQQHIHENK
jgi:hypothetical protein